MLESPHGKASDPSLALQATEPQALRAVWGRAEYVQAPTILLGLMPLEVAPPAKEIPMSLHCQWKMHSFCSGQYRKQVGDYTKELVDCKCECGHPNIKDHELEGGQK